MEFELNKLDDCIFYYMQDKTNILVDLKKVYFDVCVLCPELKNTNPHVFETYLFKALESFKQLQILEHNKDPFSCDPFECPKTQYLILNNKNIEEAPNINLDLELLGHNKTVNASYNEYHNILEDLANIKKTIKKIKYHNKQSNNVPTRYFMLRLFFVFLILQLFTNNLF